MMKTYIDTNDCSKCCGCSACVDACATGAITMEQGHDKALYPVIDQSKCVDCGRCRAVCPITNNAFGNELNEKKAYAAYLQDREQRNKSASGGAFVAVVEALKSRHPDLLVAGAVWQTPSKVIHKLVSADEIEQLRKSKYVQSDARGIYKSVKSALASDRAVLFSGTPCQVAALKAYLGKDYEKLYTVDIICHGVPGEAVLKKYLDELSEKKKSKIKEVCFRYKKKDIYGEIHSDYFNITFKNGKTQCKNKKSDSYLRGFHRGLFYRESCYFCPFANSRRNSDITLGDYWGIQNLYPDVIDYTGVSSILINTEKGNSIFNFENSMKVIETDVDFLINHNAQLRAPTNSHGKRKFFFEEFDNAAFDLLIDKSVGKKSPIKNLIKALIPGKLKRSIRRKV